MVQNLERIFVLDAIDSADALPKSQLGHPLQLHLVLFDVGPQGDLTFGCLSPCVSIEGHPFFFQSKI